MLEGSMGLMRNSPQLGQVFVFLLRTHMRKLLTTSDNPLRLACLFLHVVVRLSNSGGHGTSLLAGWVVSAVYFWRRF